jgi:hypothetical protein
MPRSKDGKGNSRNRKGKASNKRQLQSRARKRTRAKVESVLDKIDMETGLPFAELLAMEQICEVIKELGVEFRDRIYPPWVTLWAFLSQVTCQDSSCSSSVTRIIAYRTLTGRKKCSPNPSSYSTARQRLPEEFYSRLARNMGQHLDAMSPSQWLWKERHVKIVDGTTVTMPDTEANQNAYPRRSNQKNGVGFPILRITALFSLSVGTILDAEMTATKGKKTGENTSFRKLWRSLNRGDIVLGDSLYDGYSDIAQLRRRGVDVVFGMSQSRDRDFRQGKQLGSGDHIVMWKKPKFDKSRIDREIWEALPDTMPMREVTATVKDASGKPRTITLVTSLLDPDKYSKQDILNLFRERWHCELDLRCVKTMMGMEHLSCLSPEMVRKEIWTYILAYNLIRSHMARAADKYALPPRKLSFENARKAVDTFTIAITGVPPSIAAKLDEAMLYVIACHRVGNRSGRNEPRKVKRRNKSFPYLTSPRPKRKAA